MRRCSSLSASWRALLANQPLHTCSCPSVYRAPVSAIEQNVVSCSGNSWSSLAGTGSSTSSLSQWPFLAASSSSSCSGGVRWYSKHPQRESLRRANVAASRQAVAPFLKPDLNKAQPKPRAEVVDTAIPPLPQVAEPQHWTRIGRITGPYKAEPQAAFAIVQLGHTQYKVTADDVVFVPKLKDTDINDVLLLNKVLLTGTPQETHIGRPYLPNASVVATVEEHFKDAKVLVFKKKVRKRYSRLKGHRSHLTALRILQVRLPGAQPVAASAAQATAAAATPRPQQQQQQPAKQQQPAPQQQQQQQSP